MEDGGSLVWLGRVSAESVALGVLGTKRPRVLQCKEEQS